MTDHKKLTILGNTVTINYLTEERFKFEVKTMATTLGSITVEWHYEDVLSIRPDLTKYQAADVLQYALYKHDANIGINWEVLEIHAEYLFPKEDV